MLFFLLKRFCALLVAPRWNDMSYGALSALFSLFTQQTASQNKVETQRTLTILFPLVSQLRENVARQKLVRAQVEAI
jgi:hypothetical protein